MPKRLIVVLMSRHHKLLDLIYTCSNLVCTFDAQETEVQTDGSGSSGIGQSFHIACSGNSNADIQWEEETSCETFPELREQVRQIGFWQNTI
jgi:hypothetical protein